MVALSLVGTAALAACSERSNVELVYDICINPEVQFRPEQWRSLSGRGQAARGRKTMGTNK